MKLSQLRNNINLTSLKSVNYEDNDQDTLGKLPSTQSSWLNSLSRYAPSLFNYSFVKYPNFKNILSNYKYRHVTGRIRKMSFYKYLMNNTTGYTKLSKFK